MVISQLNFLTGYDEFIPKKQTLTQGVLWDEAYNVVRPINKKPSYENVNKFFTELNYNRAHSYVDYWEGLTPSNDSESFQRWLFAFMSVHTSWKANITGYQAIKGWWKWINKWDELLGAIDRSRVGMQNNRVRYISEFAYKFWENPSSYKKQPDESWPAFRNRLKNITLGLGPAKTSFAIEMCYPNTAKLSCLDTHMFQAYSLEQTKDAKHYEKLERHWVDMSNMWNIPPYIARCLYWDVKQGYLDSSYWSHVFEKQ
jgi:hypothetical protein